MIPQSVTFVRDLIDSVRAGLGRAVAFELRMDAAFFQRDILSLLRRFPVQASRS